VLYNKTKADVRRAIKIVRYCRTIFVVQRSFHTHVTIVDDKSIANMDDHIDDEAVVATYMLLRLRQKRESDEKPFGYDLG